MARANRRFRNEADAVSDVVGSIFMVAITVGMMVGLGALLFGTDPPDARRNADVVFVAKAGSDGWGTGDETVTLTHRGGEPLPRSESKIAISLNGTVTTYEGAALDGGFDDGSLTIGESWSRTFTVHLSTSVEALVIDTKLNQVVGQLQIATPGTQPTVIAQYTYVTSFTATTGTVTDFTNAQAAGDGLDATIQEATGSSSSATSRRDAVNVHAFSGPTIPDNVRTSNDARATLSAAGHFVEVKDFTNPAGINTITAVRIGIEAQRSGGGGGNPLATLSYSIAGTPGTTSQQLTVGSANDAVQMVTITGDRAWTPTDIQDLRVKLTRDSADAGVKDLDVDHLFVEITYTTTTTQDLSIDLQWSAVPSGVENVLQLRYRVVNDTFRVSVFDGTVYNNRGSITSSATTTFSYTLTLAEYNGGNPKIRLTDLDSGAGKGSIVLDYARVKTV